LILTKNGALYNKDLPEGITGGDLVNQLVNDNNNSGRDPLPEKFIDNMKLAREELLAKKKVESPSTHINHRGMKAYKASGPESGRGSKL
jgi:hypothetical protein